MSTKISTAHTYEKLDAAYKGSYYFIAGTGGSLSEWIEGYDDLLDKAGIGKPTKWVKTEGSHINDYAGLSGMEGGGDPFPPDLTCLMFPLDGLDVGKLAIFKLQMGDRWFDDVVDNMKPNYL